MPLYEYLCETCNRKFEIVHPMSGPPVSSFELPSRVEYGGDERGLFGLYHTHVRKGLAVRTKLTRLVSAPHLKTIVRGNHDFAQREKERLTKRANDHWNRRGRSEAIGQAAAKGQPVPRSWLDKETSRIK